MDVELHTIQDCMVVSPTSKCYTVSTVLFHKYEGANVAVTNCMSKFYMFVPIKSTAELANGKTGHAQGIGIILCRFPNCYIIYPVGKFYYCPGHPSNTISSGPLRFYVSFKRVTSEPLGHYDFVDPQGCSWIAPYQTQNNLDYLHIKIVKVNPHRDRNIVVPTVCAIKKNSLSLFIRTLVMSLLTD